MILGYTLPNAEENILNGTKIHTLRMDRTNKWKEGREIHHSTGNRTKAYHCFLQNKCKSTQQTLIILLKRGTPEEHLSITVDRRRLSREEVKKLAKNDGFDSETDMINWFFEDEKIDMWAGKLIHWTKLKY